MFVTYLPKGIYQSPIQEIRIQKRRSHAFLISLNQHHFGTQCMGEVMMVKKLKKCMTMKLPFLQNRTPMEKESNNTGMTILNKESRATLIQVVRALSEQQKIVEQMADAGMDIYEKLPEGLQLSSRFEKLDCSNWTLKEAALDIESAITGIKSVIE